MNQLLSNCNDLQDELAGTLVEYNRKTNWGNQSTPTIELNRIQKRIMELRSDIRIACKPEQ